MYVYSNMYIYIYIYIYYVCISGTHLDRTFKHDFFFGDSLKKTTSVLFHIGFPRPGIVANVSSSANVGVSGFAKSKLLIRCEFSLVNWWRPGIWVDMFC